MEHFRAGDKAAFSGVYKAVHDKDHIPAHYVTAFYGEIFPSCIECTNRVRFEIALSAVHVYAHTQFRRTDDQR